MCPYCGAHPNKGRNLLVLVLIVGVILFLVLKPRDADDSPASQAAETGFSEVGEAADDVAATYPPPPAEPSSLTEVQTPLQEPIADGAGSDIYPSDDKPTNVEGSSPVNQTAPPDLNEPPTQELQGLY